MADQTPLALNTYRYDPLDRITAAAQGAKTVSQRFYNQKRLATDIQGTSTRSVFEAGTSVLALHQTDLNSRDTRLLGTNVQRSVLGVVETYTTQTIAYTPYGSHSASGAMRSVLGFNGQRPDPVTGHYLLGNGVRAYSPILMRFNSPDVLSPFGEGGINTYAYCGGDPVNYEDPSGYRALSFLRALNLGDRTVTPAITRFTEGVEQQLSDLMYRRSLEVTRPLPRDQPVRALQQRLAQVRAEAARVNAEIAELSPVVIRGTGQAPAAPQVLQGLAQVQTYNQPGLNAVTQGVNALGINPVPALSNRPPSRWHVDTSYIRNVAVTRPYRSNYAGY
ncbi:RHS repeat-associated core domain-containing protein [Pseudomonas psychrophila]|uniref:RHS repeat-associated core domain-containing protein n=1 Tax=Pseudomonas psychrophila TaxID=122355 RepID=UPI0002EA527C|nr:RHS repeat-associated core domain-containing protein [Pseudomonas psychrophila]